MLQTGVRLALAAATFTLPAVAGDAMAEGTFVRVSPRDHRYFELSDGSPYIPVGLNMAEPLEFLHQDESGEDMMRHFESWMKSLSRNRGNFIRVWLGYNFWNVEERKLGEFDAARAARLDELFELARRYDIRMKLCMEQFCHVDPGESKSHRNKAIYHLADGGKWTSMTDFLQSESGRDHFRDKILWYRNRIGDDPMVFAWELWNEMDAVATEKQVWMDWTEALFVDLDAAFPKNLVTQSMGSFDYWQRRERHRWQGSIPQNDIIQVHRYIDLGAGLEVCKGPVDVMAADAVREMLAFGIDKPVLLAETGGVEPKHSGMFELCRKDHDGMILHDVLFAPFFAGAAGPGHVWFWERFVEENNLWHLYDRFSEAVEGIDPPAEGFEPSMFESSGLRVYVLKGKRTSLIWCRDASNTWETELRDGIEPRLIEDIKLPLPEGLCSGQGTAMRAYNPWTDSWLDLDTDGNTLKLPPFQRSIVLRISMP